MSAPLYNPYSSLNKEDIKSLVELCLSTDEYRVNTHGGRKAAFKYLSNILSLKVDLSAYISSKEFEQLKEDVDKLKRTDFFKKEFTRNRDDTFEPYWELNLDSSNIHIIAKNTRQFTNNAHFSPEQLKVYFNTKQIENIPFSQETYESSGYVDSDARHNMKKYEIPQRQNKGQINTKQGRIEEAVFDVPHGKQVIVLDFADERMPGGLFLYGASTQEETICYNSNTYRALLGFKYDRFDGGFMIPEFGCLYIKGVKFFKPPRYGEHRSADIIAAACYDLTGKHGLHTRPASNEEIKANTKKKFEAIIASAQANTDGNGSETYLILGPIGCGAFKNDIRIIAKLWADVLLAPLNNSLNTQQRHAFQHIWLLSGKNEKLEVFEQAFNLNKGQRL